MRPTLLCMSDDKRRPRPAVQYGATASAVAQNVRRFRERRGMTIYSLSGALGRAGRPITPSAIAKIEKQQRQVTVDDLTALAEVLDVSPPALLLPPRADGDVSITPEKTMPWQAAWRWVLGEQPPFTPDGGDDPREEPNWPERRRRFLSECQPHRDPNHIHEIARYVASRIDGPWHLEVDSNGETEHGTLSLHSERTKHDDREMSLEDAVHALAAAQGIDLAEARIRVYGRIAKNEGR